VKQRALGAAMKLGGGLGAHATQPEHQRHRTLQSTRATVPHTTTQARATAARQTSRLTEAVCAAVKPKRARSTSRQARHMPSEIVKRQRPSRVTPKKAG
jgi:hypothetical protein